MTRKEVKLKAAEYPKFVEWNEEDQCFVGRCPGLFEGAIHGKDEAAVYAELCQTAEEWVTILHKEGIPLPDSLTKKKFSGKFVLRVEPALHRRLAAKALASGESLNAFCEKALAKA